MVPRLDESWRHERIEVYRAGLLESTLPFWMEHAVDCEFGGFQFCLGRDGSVISPDKPVWLHGRFVWTLSTLYNTVERRGEWLDLARHGVEFLRAHCFDSDGRMFFTVTRDGRPLRKRRYFFSECFAAIGLAAYARASGEERAKAESFDLFEKIVRYATTPGLLEPKVNPETRSTRGLVVPMILISVAQVLREAIGCAEADAVISRSTEEIEQFFVKDELRAVLESVDMGGGLVDTFEGRMLAPGHSIEAGWFVLHESMRSGDPGLLKLGLDIVDYSWEWGWDPEYGGLFYYRDVKNLSPSEYWHDMKFWWPHNEAIIAALLAYRLSGDTKYLDWHNQVHDWAYAHFPDPEFGEWFGYLHRDGRLSTPLKGNLWKGPFHLPRQEWYCWKLLENWESDEPVVLA